MTEEIKRGNYTIDIEPEIERFNNAGSEKEVEDIAKSLTFVEVYALAKEDYAIVKDMEDIIIERFGEETYKDICKVAVESNTYNINRVPEELKKEIRLEEEIRNISPENFLENNNKLYKKLLIETDVPKEKLATLFQAGEIFADKDGNAIFPTNYENGKMTGAYLLDLKVGTIEELGKIEKEVNIEIKEIIQSFSVEELEIEEPEL